MWAQCGPWQSPARRDQWFQQSQAGTVQLRAAASIAWIQQGHQFYICNISCPASSPNDILSITTGQHTAADKNQRTIYWHNIHFCSQFAQTYEGHSKVRRLTQLIARYVHNTSSLFNTVSCKWNALGPAFLQSSDFGVEELLIVLFQPAMPYAMQIMVFRSKLPLTWGIWTPSNTWFLWAYLSPHPKWQ